MRSRFLGHRHREPARNWIPTVGVWGAMGAVGLVWATGWRLILDWVPYNNGKFKRDNSLNRRPADASGIWWCCLLPSTSETAHALGMELEEIHS
ncbi:cytochrome b-c1 complex subunit 10-like [Mesoplodon densirostris]|uniref:cytochrome b-c1 complex subunit 10-like n=1 Tax=Mesoplodon densirostris TaxID=48708 RepID=UPI0028DAFB76|nr:cytochrome b-c1 complex subunit 10-like [Mesoplodon densirostris]